MMRVAAPVALIAAACLLPAPAAADHGSGAGSIPGVPSASILHAGETTVAFLYERSGLESLSDADLERLAARSADGHIEAIDLTQRFYVVVEHGLASDLTLGVTFSLQEVSGYREMHLEEGGAVEKLTGDPSGVGDVWVRARYRLAPTATSATSLLGGLKVPSGDDGHRLSSGSTIELANQPSSGSFDGLVGLAHARRLGERMRVGAGIELVARGSGSRQQRLGRRVVGGADLGYQLNARPDDRWIWSASLGLLVHDQAAMEEDGVQEESSGGRTLFLLPGIAARRGSWTIGLGGAAPVAQRRNGVQQELGVAALAGLTYSLGGDHDDAAEPHDHLH